MHTLVCIAPHPDDEVLSSGALLMKARDAGYELHLVWASRGQKSMSAAASRRWDEASEVARRLHAKVTGLDLEDGHLDLGTVISVVEKVLKEIQPEHVVWPHGIGPAHHQDHRVVHEAVANILKRWDYAKCAWLVGQPPVFDDQGFQPSLFVGYGQNEFEEICGLMGFYESEKRKDFAQSQFLDFRGRHWAYEGRTHTTFAEPYMLVKGIPSSDLFKSFIVEFFDDADGKYPVLEFIDSFGPNERSLILATLSEIRVQGGDLDVEYVQHVKNGIRRCCISVSTGCDVDVLYFAPADGQFVLLHAYSGSTSTVPPNELQCAEERMLAWREQHK